MQNKNKKEEEIFITWRAQEYPHHEKSLLWFVIASLIVTSLVIYGLMTDGWTFSMAIIVASGAYYVSHRTPPQVVTMSVTSRGVRIGRHLLEYPTIKNFWIAFNPPLVRRLYLRMQPKFSADIVVDVHDVDVTELRQVLKKHLTENEKNAEPFSDTLIRLLRL